MKILNAQQIREWDQWTIQHKPVASIELMESAAAKCDGWIEENIFFDSHFIIFCGKGNNGGDGLALARMLSQRDCKVFVYILEFGHLGTEDFQLNLARLHQYPQVEIKFIQTENQFPPLRSSEVVVDALFGSGLNRPLEGVTAKLVDHINDADCETIAIDVPSGLPVDHAAKGKSIVRANHTLTFQTIKLSFLLQENASFIGDVHVLEIGLSQDYYDSVSSPYEFIDDKFISAIYKPRNRFAHKGNFGHALIIAGAYGKMGAAVLATEGCLRTGAGLTTSHIPTCGYEIMQTAVPEAMVMTDFNSSVITNIEEDLSKFNVIGIGPGIGTATETRKVLHWIFETYKKPIVLDADALNLLSSDKGLLTKIPSGSVLTPHPKEFERLFGKSDTDYDRLQLAQQKAKELDIVIVLKGHHSAIAAPGGQTYFNSTGNPGMAKGGSGDVLTGILAALVAQGYDGIEASVLGVYLHGLAADIAAGKYSQEAMIARDILDNLGEAFIQIAQLM